MVLECPGDEAPGKQSMAGFVFRECMECVLHRDRARTLGTGTEYQGREGLAHAALEHGSADCLVQRAEWEGVQRQWAGLGLVPIEQGCHTETVLRVTNFVEPRLEGSTDQIGRRTEPQEFECKTGEARDGGVFVLGVCTPGIRGCRACVGVCCTVAFVPRCKQTHMVDFERPTATTATAIRVATEFGRAFDGDGRRTTIVRNDRSGHTTRGGIAWWHFEPGVGFVTTREGMQCAVDRGFVREALHAELAGTVENVWCEGIDRG